MICAKLIIRGAVLAIAAPTIILGLGLATIRGGLFSEVGA